MSKTTPKQRAQQLKEWLDSRKNTASKKSNKPTFSKMDHYKKSN